jgi:hypothetical protein
VSERAKIFYFDKPNALNQEDKIKIRDYLIEIGCGDNNSDNPTLIKCDMINQIKGRAHRTK